ncbi:MAG: HI1506-related protein [Betaproteobacteria bacterium]
MHTPEEKYASGAGFRPREAQEATMSKVLIRSVGDSFRRAGIAFTREGQVFSREDLTDEQIEAISHEPRLFVTPVDDVDSVDTKSPTPADSKPAAKAKGK